MAGNTLDIKGYDKQMKPSHEQDVNTLCNFRNDASQHEGNSDKPVYIKNLTN